MTPLRVVFHLTPNRAMREPTHLIHLDDLLAFCRVENEKIHGTARDFGVIEDLPLDKQWSQDGKEWVWAASALKYEVQRAEIGYWCRKTDLGKIVGDIDSGKLAFRAKEISLSSGPWKAYSQTESLIHTPVLQAWCVGDKDRITALLKRLTHIGKKRNRGYGEIASIDIVEDPSAREEVLFRTFPWELDSNRYARAVCGVRPPYWKTQEAFYPLC